MSAFGSQSMALPLKRVIMRMPDRVMAGAERDVWHYGPQFDPRKASDQHRVFADLVAQSGADITWIRDGNDGLSDSIFTHDPSLVTDQGAVLLRMGKNLRLDEPDLHDETYRQMDVPVLGRIEAPGTVEGGDCVWVDSKTLAVGRGVRTNQAGIEQLSAISEAARHHGSRFRSAALAWRRSLPASDVDHFPARRGSRAGAPAPVAGSLLPAPEGARHPPCRGA